MKMYDSENLVLVRIIVWLNHPLPVHLSCTSLLFSVHASGVSFSHVLCVCVLLEVGCLDVCLWVSLQQGACCCGFGCCRVHSAVSLVFSYSTHVLFAQ